MTGQGKMTEHPTPVRCWFCQAPVSPDERGKLIATDPAIEMPGVCPENMAGHRTRLEVNWEDTPELKAAWLAYDKVARDLPQCEHVLAWQAELAAAKKAHHQAIRNRDKLWTAQVKAETEAHDRAVQEALAADEARVQAGESDDLPAGAVAEEPDPGQAG